MSVNICFFSTVDRPFVRDYIKSLNKHQWKYTWLGKSLENHLEYKLSKTSTRTIIVYNYLKSLKSDDYIVLTDCFGVLCNQSPETFIKKFLTFESPIVMGCLNKKSLLSSKTLNIKDSSFVAGKVMDLISVLQENIKKNNTEYSKCWVSENIKIDKDNKLFCYIDNFYKKSEISNSFFIKFMNYNPQLNLSFFKKDFKINNYIDYISRNIPENEAESEFSSSDSMNSIQVSILVLVILLILILIIIFGVLLYYIYLNHNRKPQYTFNHLIEYSGFTNTISDIRSKSTTKNQSKFQLI